MARSRFIKPEFFDNPVLARCSHGARLLFAATWQIADRCGVFEWDPVKLRKYAFGYEDITVAQVSSMLAELQGCDFIRSATVQGKEYGLVVNLAKHQKFHIAEKPRFEDIAASANWGSTYSAPTQHPASTVPESLSLETENGDGERRTAVAPAARAPQDLDRKQIGIGHPEITFFEAEYHRLFKGPPLTATERAMVGQILMQCAVAKRKWRDVLDFYARGFDFSGHTVDWLHKHLREVLNKFSSPPKPKPAQVRFGDDSQQINAARQRMADENSKKLDADRAIAVAPEIAMAEIEQLKAKFKF